MKKLVYIAPDFFPERKANSIHVENQVNSLANQGVVVHLFYKSYSGQKSGVLHENVIEYPIKIAKVKCSNLKFLIALLRKDKLLRSMPILTRSRLSVILALPIFSSKQILFEAHEPLNRLWLKVLVKFIDLPILAISTALKKIIDLELNASSRIFVLHDGSTLVDFSGIRALKKDKPKAVYVGSTCRGRGIDLILKLAERHVDWDFHIVGTFDEVYNKRLINLNNVIIHGWKIKSEILQIVKNADVLLAPYQKDLKLDNGLNTLDYMSPLKIFEYMSFNVPLVVSDFPVIREVLVDKIDAFLVEPEDLNKWSFAIKSILSNPDLARRLRMNALDKLKKYYTWEKRSEEIIKMFDWKE